MRYSRLGRGRMGVILALMLFASLLSPITALAAPAQSNQGNTEWAQVYTVQRGDTLAEIAWSFGVSENALLKANSLRNPDLIYVGQQLIIPENYSHGTGGPECESYYTVRRGDTLSEIALYNGIDEYALARANAVYDLNDIYVGQKLCIPGSGGGKHDEPKWEPEKPDYDEPQRPHDGGCNPCDGPKNEGPKNDGPKNDGPQRPADEPQRPHDGGCNPCDGPKNEGPQRPSDEQQRPHDNGCDPCDGPHKPDQPRPTEYWKGMYFNDKYFSEFALERQDLEVNFNWLTGSPISNVNQDRFSVRWEKVEYFKGGSYRFYAIADDGVRVYVDDQLIIDAWVIQPATEYKADINLSEGAHKLVVEYYEEAEDAQIRVYWEPRQHKK